VHHNITWTNTKQFFKREYFFKFVEFFDVCDFKFGYSSSRTVILIKSITVLSFYCVQTNDHGSAKKYLELPFVIPEPGNKHEKNRNKFISHHYPKSLIDLTDLKETFCLKMFF
jgi:hypothetical protein